MAVAVTYDTTISASTEVTLNAATSRIDVCAITQAILMRWGTGDASTSAFDEVIPAGTVRTFKRPPATTAVNFIEQAASAILVLIEK